jgi:hypothetical protein
MELSGQLNGPTALVPGERPQYPLYMAGDWFESLSEHVAWDRAVSWKFLSSLHAD